MSLNLKDALKKGVEAHRSGKFQEAELIYQAILKADPKNSDANHNLGAIAVSFNKVDEALPFFSAALKSNPKIEQFWSSYIDALIKAAQFQNAEKIIKLAKRQGLSSKLTAPFEAHLENCLVKKSESELEPSKEVLKELLQYYNTGLIDNAEQLAQSLTQEFPNHAMAWKVLGAVSSAKGQLKDAHYANKRVVELSPQDAGSHNNLSISLQQLGLIEKAAESCKRAIELNYNFPEAHNNLGSILLEQGKFQEAADCFLKSNTIDPNFQSAASNLISVLTCVEPKEKYNNKIVSANRQLQRFSELNISKKISQMKEKTIFEQSVRILQDFRIEYKIESSQCYRRNSVAMDCKRHMDIFNQFSIIPEACFSCYKVQFLPRSFIELLRLYLIFDRLELQNQNIRKWMIELRPNIPGFYKGFI